MPEAIAEPLEDTLEEELDAELGTTGIMTPAETNLAAGVEVVCDEVLLVADGVAVGAEDEADVLLAPGVEVPFPSIGTIGTSGMNTRETLLELSASNDLIRAGGRELLSERWLARLVMPTTLLLEGVLGSRSDKVELLGELKSESSVPSSSSPPSS